MKISHISLQKEENGYFLALDLIFPSLDHVKKFLGNLKGVVKIDEFEEIPGTKR